ncbi:MAG TPA: hypothetical protein DIT10_03720 [Chryseobacterium sp.]|nr:hypothetical protein [Chryseobacterium sp.]
MQFTKTPPWIVLNPLLDTFFKFFIIQFFYWVNNKCELRNISKGMIRLPMVEGSSYSKGWHSSAVVMTDKKNSIPEQFLLLLLLILVWRFSLNFS